MTKTPAQTKPAIVLFLFLAATWFSLSGHTEPLLLGLGAISCAFVTFLTARLGLLGAGPPPPFLLRLFLYGPWLFLEILKSSWQVTKLILHPKLPISPAMVRVIPSQKTLLGKVIFANSITVTPGTLTVEVDPEGFWVHALEKHLGEELEAGSMDGKVRWLEGRD